MYDKYPNVPEHIRESIYNYVEHGHDPGSFLRAVLQRDLMSCIEYAVQYIDAEGQKSIKKGASAMEYI